MSGSAATPGVCTAMDRIAAAESINDLRLRMGATITKKGSCVEVPKCRAAAARAQWLSALVWAGMLPWSAASHAGNRGSDHLWKLTVGEYLYAADLGTDVNLRWRDAGT